MNRPFGVLCLASLLALTACPAKTDYGRGCNMTKPTDGGTLPIQVIELTDPGFDYIALGSAECDDLVCLRTAKQCETAEDCPDNTPCTESGFCAQAYEDNQDNTAVGYCTRGCVEDSDCQPDFQGKRDVLVCAELLFSDEYMEALKADCDTNPNCLYNQIFGSGASSRYCIKPRSVAQ